MAAQPFTRNYADHSNETGYQFEFFCDKCGNGHRSAFQTSTLGVAAQVLRGASWLFGERLSAAGNAAGHLKDALRGPAWDSAYAAAVAEIQPKFHLCTKCGRWVCPSACWNERAQLCEECAPDMGEAAAAVQAQVAVEQLWQKARETDQTQGADLSSGPGVAVCPSCNARLKPGAKFCSECGVAIQPKKQHCAACGVELSDGARFCSGCGASV